MTQPPSGFRFVTSPDLEQVADLMQVTWKQPSWLYSPELLGYHLRRPDVDPELLIGLEDAHSGDLVAYYAFMPVAAEIGAVTHRAIFGSFLTASPAVQGHGAARAVQLRLLELAMEKGYDFYLAFCEEGAVSNHSIRRSCASAGLATETLTSVAYHATPCSAQRRQPNAHTRPFSAEDEAAALDMILSPNRENQLRLSYHGDGYRHRWVSPAGRSFVFEQDGVVRAFLHLALFEVLDGGQRLRNAYVQDLASGDLSPSELSDFIGAAILQIEAGACRLVLAPAVGDMTDGVLAEVGFRKTPRRLNLLATPLAPGATLSAASIERFSLDVF